MCGMLKKLGFFYKHSFQNWSPKLGQHAAENGMKKAFEAWADYANLRFVRKPANSDADISISFSRLYHGDRYKGIHYKRHKGSSVLTLLPLSSYPFDGKGLVLAHAYYPTKYGTFSGDIHFDEDEDWWSSDGVQRNRLESPISFSFGKYNKTKHKIPNFRCCLFLVIFFIDDSAVAAHELGHSLGLVRPCNDLHALS